MLKILTSILLLMNPLAGLLAVNQPKQAQAPAPEAPLFLEAQEKLPLSEDVFLAAQYLPIYPIRNWNVDEPNIPAQTAMVFETGRQLILFQKNWINDSRPIASMTKLMTALVIMENAKLDDVYTVSKNAVGTYGEMGDLKVGEKLTVKDLLAALLIGSSNDAAVALAENLKEKSGYDLVELMNQKAKAMCLKNTSYADPSGLDPANISSAWDLTKVMQEALKYPILSQVMTTPSADIQSVDGKFTSHIVSTDKLLGIIPEIVGGKTGYTEEAGNCMILAIKSPNNEGFLISVVMGASDRMAETETLINWTKKAFFW